MRVVVVVCGLSLALSGCLISAQDEAPYVAIGDGGGGGPHSRGISRPAPKQPGSRDVPEASELVGANGAVDDEALFLFLQARAYEGFPHERDTYPSPRGWSDRRVRAFVEPELYEAMEGDDPVLPVGSMAVEELYEADGRTMIGWAVSLKVSDHGDGRDWYWYENQSTTENLPTTRSVGAQECMVCHAQSADGVLSPFPLR